MVVGGGKGSVRGTSKGGRVVYIGIKGRELLGWEMKIDVAENRFCSRWPKPERRTKVRFDENGRQTFAKQIHLLLPFSAL